MKPIQNYEWHVFIQCIKDCFIIRALTSLKNPLAIEVALKEQPTVALIERDALEQWKLFAKTNHIKKWKFKMFNGEIVKSK